MTTDEIRVLLAKPSGLDRYQQILDLCDQLDTVRNDARELKAERDTNHPDTELVDKLERNVAKFWGGCRGGSISITAGAVIGHPVQYCVELHDGTKRISRTTGPSLSAAIVAIPEEEPAEEDIPVCPGCSEANGTEGWAAVRHDPPLCKTSAEIAKEREDTPEEEPNAETDTA